MEIVARMLARERFAKARRRAVREDWGARLASRWRGLLPYDPLIAALQAPALQGIPRLSTIQLDRIVGSVGHGRDFTLGFWPRASVSRERWVEVDVAMSQPAGVPPIDVFQIGDKYFVADGNHRVSVARANGLRDIEAYVTVLTLPAEDRTETLAAPLPVPAVEAFSLAVPGWLRRLWDHAAAFIDDLLTA
jgi:hypothetical protein